MQPDFDVSIPAGAPARRRTGRNGFERIGPLIDAAGYRYPIRVLDQRLVLSGLMMMSMMTLVVST